MLTGQFFTYLAEWLTHRSSEKWAYTHFGELPPYCLLLVPTLGGFPSN